MEEIVGAFLGDALLAFIGLRRDALVQNFRKARKGDPGALAWLVARSQAGDVKATRALEDLHPRR